MSLLIAMPWQALADQLNGDSDSLAAGIQSGAVNQTLAAGAFADLNLGAWVKSTGSTHVTFPVSVSVSKNQSWISLGTSGGPISGYDIANELSVSARITAPSTGLTCGVTNGFVGKVTFSSGASGLNPNTQDITINLSVPGPACDTTAPDVTPHISGTLGTNSWYTSNVTVAWDVSDEESAITSSTGCDATTVSADTTGATVTCTATSAGGSASESVTIKRDATDPAITGARTPAANGYGWNNVDVTVSFTCADATSDIASCEGGTTLTDEGADRSVTGTATDNAGNTKSVTVSGINIDKTKPTISGSASPTANANGWNNTNVVVSFDCHDALSDIASCAAPIALSTEGAGQSASGTATDRAGNSDSTTVGGINIDKTSPVVSGLSAGPLPVGAALASTQTIVETLSGVDSTKYQVDGIDATTAPSAAGVYTLCLFVTDKAGNTNVPTLINGGCALLPVYDPNGGFVTGGGWIMSPAGAYTADASLAGKATFGFVSKYQKGANTPVGNTEFQFQTGKLNFSSDSYQWLVVAGAKAQYKGTGTVNGASGYSFMLTATDGQMAGGGGADRFRIKIWNTSTGAIVYDNAPGSDDIDSSSTQSLGGGSVVIHK